MWHKHCHPSVWCDGCPSLDFLTVAIQHPGSLSSLSQFKCWSYMHPSVLSFWSLVSSLCPVLQMGTGDQNPGMPTGRVRQKSQPLLRILAPTDMPSSGRRHLSWTMPDDLTELLLKEALYIWVMLEDERLNRVKGLDLPRCWIITIMKSDDGVHRVRLLMPLHDITVNSCVNTPQSHVCALFAW